MNNSSLPCRSHCNESRRNVFAALFILSSHMTPLCWHHRSIARQCTWHYIIIMAWSASGLRLVSSVGFTTQKSELQPGSESDWTMWCSGFYAPWTFVVASAVDHSHACLHSTLSVHALIRTGSYWLPYHRRCYLCHYDVPKTTAKCWSMTPMKFPSRVAPKE